MDYGTPGFLRVAVVLLLFVNLMLIYNSFSVTGRTTDFGLLDLSIAQLDAEKFHEIQDGLSIKYSALRSEINNTIRGERGEYGFYFEDLTTGAWVGINERKDFIPASLFKLPAVVAVVKKVENGDMNLGDVITLEETDIERDYISGSLSDKGVGYRMTLYEVLSHTLNESDNTALNVVTRHLTYGELTEAYVAAELPWPKFTGKVEDNLVSPKKYMNMFRSLYYSTYLRRAYSQLILSLLVEANFDSALPAGVNSKVKVANKVGFYNRNDPSFHDCGIVYASNPYMICIMSVNTTQADFDRVASSISRKVFDYVSAP